MDGNAVSIPLPEAFLKRTGEQLGEELLSFLESLEDKPIRGLRMNPFRAGAEKPFRDAGRKVLWCRDGWELPAESQAGVTAAHEAGAFYLQEPCAMLPGAVMAARPGERILDLCAAPGGKSTQMGLDLAGEGLLISNEPIPKRAAVLSRNLERMGIPNSIVTCAYPDALAERWPEAFDGVLADVPCSGEGMFRRHPETRREWTAERAAGCAARQKDILRSAARLVRPGGRLVYSTCTWNPAENELQVLDFLREHPDFEPDPFSLPGAEGKEGMFTCWPHRTRGEGQFTARLHRRGDGQRPRWETGAFLKPSKEDMRAWETGSVPTRKPAARFDDTLIWIPEIPDLSGIRTLRLGMHVGTVQGKIFRPDHASALDIQAPAAPATEAEDGDALRYLAGETISGDAAGWTLVTWRGLVLGWGKGDHGVIKNHYPKGLRNGKLIL